MPGFEGKPTEVQEAIRKDDREKLCTLGRAGARARARNLAERKAFVEAAAADFYEDRFAERFQELVEEWMRENDITDAQGTPIDEEDLPEYIPDDVVEHFTTEADKTASALLEMKRRMSGRR